MPRTSSATAFRPRATWGATPTDSLYRLNSASGTTDATYGYDPAGNRVTMGGTTYSYDRADRITTVGSTSYTVNANGNLVARGSDSFGYDQANRLKTASVSGTSSTYAYDGDGKRTSKTVGGSAANYIYDVNASLPVLLDDGTRKYVWGLGLAFAVDTSGNPLVYHTDGLGSVRAITDGSGSVVQTYRYDEYGNVTSSSGSITQPFQYTGEARDAETGFMYLRARIYDVGTGRFLMRDVESGRTDAPDTLHRYGYVTDNPMLGTDPSGFGMIVPCKSPSGGIKSENQLVSILCDVIDPTDVPSVILGVSDTPEGAGATILYRLYGMAARPIGGVITGFTKHGINRVIERGIRPYEILDTVSNAIRVTEQNNDTIRYVGRWAMIVVNKVGEVVTAVRFKPPWAP